MPEKYARAIRSHIRSRGAHKFKVSGYTQRYDKPRGPVGRIDAPLSDHTTVWLKNELGEFIGRAGPRGNTHARKARTRSGGSYKVTDAGSDKTHNQREMGKYGRILGRVSEVYVRGRKR